MEINERCLYTIDIFEDLKNSLFTTKEAMEYLEVSSVTLCRYIKDGKLVASKKLGKTCFYSLDDLRELKRGKKFKSSICASIHSTARGLHQAGVLDEKTMRKFDEACLSELKGIKNKKPL